MSQSKDTYIGVLRCSSYLGSTKDILISNLTLNMDALYVLKRRTAKILRRNRVFWVERSASEMGWKQPSDWQSSWQNNI